MPQVTSKIIRFAAQDWLAGLSQQYDTSLGALPPIAGAGNTLLKGIDPFRALGYLSPAPLAASPTNASAISEVLMNIAYGQESTTSYGYMIEQGSKLHRLALSTFTISNSGSWPHTVTGTGAITGDDCISYPVNVSGTRTRSILYSWNDSGGAWNVGKFNTSAGTFDDDWFTTVPAGTFTPSGNANRHPLFVGVDDVCYVGDGNKVHAIDGYTGTDGTVSEEVLTLPSDFVITAFAQYGVYIAVFAYKQHASATLATSSSASTTNATCFLWNPLELDIETSVTLNDDFVSSARSFNNTIICFTHGAQPAAEVNGATRLSRLKMFDGSRFVTVKSFIGNPPLYGGVAIMNDSIHWLSNNGNVFVYGSPYEDVQAGLNITNDATGTSQGLYAITPGGSGYAIASSGTSTSGGLERFKTSYADSATYISGAATPSLGPGEVAQVKSVTVYFGKTMSAADGQVTVSLISENATTTGVISNLNQVTTSNIVKKVSYTTSGTKPPRFQELRLAVTFSGSSATQVPLIRYVDVEYEIKNSYP